MADLSIPSSGGGYPPGDGRTVQGEYVEGEEQEAREEQGEEPQRGVWHLPEASADNTPVSSHTCSLWLLAPP